MQETHGKSTNSGYVYTIKLCDKNNLRLAVLLIYTFMKHNLEML